MCAHFVAAKMQLESVRGLSTSSEAATGGQVGAAVIKVQHPLPSACLESHNPPPELKSHFTQTLSLDFIFCCFWFACWRLMSKIVVKNALFRYEKI